MLVVSSDADCGRLSGAKPTPLGACEAEKSMARKVVGTRSCCQERELQTP